MAVVPQRLLYIAEVVGMYGVHDLNLIWLTEPSDLDQAIEDSALIPLGSHQAEAIMPPIADQIAADAQSGWPPEPRWLGNLRRPPQQG